MCLDFVQETCFPVSAWILTRCAPRRPRALDALASKHRLLFVSRLLDLDLGVALVRNIQATHQKDSLQLLHVRKHHAIHDLWARVQVR